ncbi:hypothetical protein [Streptomyces sp. Ac-502]|uniref:hypothetical protein n=1 Tax=Streptomyces sp. Ac-502 TaxID=3342801 RepID=UPI0038622474
MLAQRLGLFPDAAFQVLTAQAPLHRSPVPDLAPAFAEEPDGPWPPRAPGDRPR